MAFFSDLTPYTYAQSDARPNVLNIGWLESGHDFPKRPPSHDFLKRLWLLCKIPVQQMRGFQTCHFCSTPKMEMPRIEFEGELMHFGSAEIRVFSTENTIYAAPNLIFHYVRDHHYAPPEEFVRATLDGPHPESIEYLAALRASGDAPEFFPVRLRSRKTENSD